MKILVVDDDKSQRELLSRLLTQLGHEPRVKSTLDEGRRFLAPYVRDVPPSLGGMILDWCLRESWPREYSRDIARMAIGSGIPIVFRTGTLDTAGELNMLVRELEGKGVEVSVWSKEWDSDRTIEAIRGLVEGKVGGNPEKR